MPTSLAEKLAHKLGQPLVSSRRIVTGSGARVRGIFPSHRFRREMPWESPLERLLVYRLEASWLVQDAVMQPARLALVGLDGESFDYTPDAVICTKSGDLVVLECKPEADLQDPELRKKHTAIRLNLARAGIRFVEVSETVLDAREANQNVRTLCRARRYRTNHASKARIEALLERRSPCTFAEASSIAGASAATHMLAIGKLFFDVRRLLAPSTLLLQTLTEAGDAAHFIHA